ncbi:MAG: hemoglobin-like protein HbO [Ferruginibacter sp.]|nr:hemoglobin-like protein HbO [Ferruginibacter sp.]
MLNERETNGIPTLYEWAGGMAVFEKPTDVFYKKVLHDSLLEPVFKHMSAQHQLHVAHFIAEVFGGPSIYSTEEGNHFKMKQKHLAKHLTEQHRKDGLNF